MIQNKKILEKVEKKTEKDIQLREFITAILERESEGKHYSSFYKSQIAKKTKERG